MAVVLHLMSLAGYRDTHGDIAPASLATEGFVHCTADAETLLAVANRFYRDAEGDHVALEIDTDRLTAPVRYEAASPAPPPGVADTVRFPHVYGPIDRAAVVGLRYARRRVDGEFTGFERPPRIAARLELLPHPEGGWFRRTWASDQRIATPRGERAAGTAILFLLADGQTSSWHTVASDELWLWHGPGEVHVETGPGAVTVLDGDRPQLLVPAGTPQRARAAGDVLVSCVVCPGFDYADFELL